ncbi:MAG: YwbE family protein [Spirochaetales bacterium]|nr:MAG: YwbE family protein [Spirochaetales bacterium]
MDGRQRADIRVGSHVSVVQKADQGTGALTEGIVQRILTNSAFHPHGIKVKLSSGEVGRVAEVHD